jgi:signal transduction histidine kinase
MEWAPSHSNRGTGAIELRAGSEAAGDAGDADDARPDDLTGAAAAYSLHPAGRGRGRGRARESEDWSRLRLIGVDDPHDRLAPFRPAILAVRWGTVGVGLLLAGGDLQQNRTSSGFWALVLVAYAALRTFRPIRITNDWSGVIALFAEVALLSVAVMATGFWGSPFVFCMITPIVIAGFARGFAFALGIVAVSVVVIGVPDYVRNEHELRVGGQWAAEFVLVALVAGYTRRISGEADRQQSLALDRLGRLADANALLFSLHRVAQSLPASLDLNEALDSTMGRMRDLFDFTVAAVLLYDETDDGWVTARREGTRLPPRFATHELPAGLVRAIDERQTISQSNLLTSSGTGLAPDMHSGIYAALVARGSVIGLVSIEHPDPRHFTERDVELLKGFAEPAALALDNARWFGRLRTVGAEEERTRIARDLHDHIGQSLAYLAFELDRIVKTSAKGEDVGASLEQLRSDVRDVIRDVRDTLYDLRTDVSDTHDLVAVLDMYLQRVRERTGLDIVLRSQDTGRLPLLQEREFFRIAQEALANIEKHAGARHVTVLWQCDGTTAVLEVGDDGKGFPIGRAGRLDSYGIIGMRERAASIGATLDLQSTPGVGTRVRCLLGITPPPRVSLLGHRRASR